MSHTMLSAIGMHLGLIHLHPEKHSVTLALAVTEPRYSNAGEERGSLSFIEVTLLRSHSCVADFKQTF